MAAPTVNVTVSVFDPDGVAIQGAVVTAQLSGIDTYGSDIIYPYIQSQTTDVNGNAVLPLFPNVLGGQNTLYTFRATLPNAVQSGLLASGIQVPDNDCNLATLIPSVLLPPASPSAQPLSAILTSLAGLVATGDNLIPYFTAPATFGMTAFTALGIALVGSASAAAGATVLGLGTANAPVFAGLTLSNLTPDSIPYAGTGGLMSQDNTNLAWNETTQTLTAKNVIISGGTISGVSLSLDSLNNTPVGNTTPSTGAFTTLGASGAVTFGGLSPDAPVFTGAGGLLVSNTVTGTGSVVLSASPTLTGTLTAAAITASGSVTAAACIPSGATVPANGMYLPAANTLGWATNSTEQMTLDAAGNLKANGLSTGSAAVSNVRFGYGALAPGTTGIDNTASGVSALYSNTTGYTNTASGLNALYSNTTGNFNTASGAQARSRCLYRRASPLHRRRLSLTQQSPVSPQAMRSSLARVER